MPSVLTHYMFGEEAIKSLPEGLISNQEERHAFLIGCHGPDPLCIRHTTTLKRGTTTRHIARDMHHHHMTSNFMCLREGVEHLSLSDQGLGRAFVLGFLSHWLLDSMAHPFVFAQQNEICSVDENLAKSPSEVHALIETDIDCWLLWTRRHQTILDFPVANIVVREPHTEHVMSSLIAYTAQNVFGTTIPNDEYIGALKDFERVFRVIDPVGGFGSKFASTIELTFRPNSRVLAQGHNVWTSDECPAANLDHRPWSNAASGISSTMSFPEIMDAALDRWPYVLELLIRGDEEGLRAEIAGRNYVGICVPDV